MFLTFLLVPISQPKLNGFTNGFFPLEADMFFSPLLHDMQNLWEFVTFINEEKRLCKIFTSLSILFDHLKNDCRSWMKNPTKMLCLSLESHCLPLSIDMRLNLVPLLCPELWRFKVECQKKLWSFFNSFCQTIKLAALKKLPYLRTYLTYRKLMPTVGTGRPSRFQIGVTRFCSLNTFRVINDQRLCNIFPDTR